MSQTQVKTGVQATRTHDHLYDPVYTVSNMNVHVAETQKANMANVERIPVHQAMFSDVATHPRHEYRMKQPPIPMPMYPQAGETRNVPDSTVLGQLRFKYFKRPVVPFLHSVPAEILLAPVNGGETEGVDVIDEPATKTIGTQSMYREGETQTDPYTPDYITTPGQDDPEILDLVHLTYGKGLPATLEEVNLVHRMREKRAFEESLPPITDEESFQIRKRMLEQREMKEWQQREDEMKKEQEDKLQVLIDTLRARENKKEELNEARVEKIRQEKTAERDRTFEQVHAQRVKGARIINKTRPHTEKQATKRDIIEEHASFGSKVYAPIAYQGRLPVKNQVVDYGIPLISNYQGLAALEATLPSSTLRLQVKEPQKIIPKSAVGRKGQQVIADLAYVDKLMQDKKVAKKEVVIENVYKKFEPVTRAPVPSVCTPEDDEENTSVLLLQRMIRGRAMQNEMFTGKQRNIHLIRELRVEEDPPMEMEGHDSNKILSTAVDTIQGEVLSNALNFIAKEVVRVHDQRKIAKMVWIAAQKRRIREAEESGRRQVEDVVRKKNEQQFAETLDIHSSTADRFLDGVFDQAVEGLAEKQARAANKLKSNYLDDMLNEFDQKYSSDEATVQDLVSTFLLPEVDRQLSERQDNLEHRRIPKVAHETLQQAIEKVAIVNGWTGGQ